MFLRPLRWLLLAYLLLLSSLTSAAEDQLTQQTLWTTLDQPAIEQTSLVEVTPTGKLRYEHGTSDGKKQQELPLTQIMRWGKWQPLQAGPYVVLHDRSQIRGEVNQWTKEQLSIESLDGLEEIQLPLNSLQELIIQPRLWERLATTINNSVPANQQLLVLSNGDTQTVSITAWQDKQLICQLAGQDIKLPLNQIVAIRFPTPEQAPIVPETSFLVGCRDGSWFHARQLTRQKNRWHCETIAGGKLQVEQAELCALQPLTKQIAYLSDLTPSSYKSIPWLTLTTPAAFDRNVAGGSLRCHGEFFRKGIGLRSAARITYDLNREYSKFETSVGLDDTAGPRGHAIGKVYGDAGDGKWQLLHETQPLTVDQKPQTIRLDVQQCTRISLLVDFGLHGDQDDLVNWLEPRLIRVP
jgi:hypothetical protein